MGFFSGLVPRIVGDVIFVLLASSLTYGVNIYVTNDDELQMYTSATMSVSNVCIVVFILCSKQLTGVL